MRTEIAEKILRFIGTHALMKSSFFDNIRLYKSNGKTMGFLDSIKILFFKFCRDKIDTNVTYLTGNSTLIIVQHGERKQENIRFLTA